MGFTRGGLMTVHEADGRICDFSTNFRERSGKSYGLNLHFLQFLMLYSIRSIH